MRKRLRKSIAGILALLMVVTNFQLNGLQVKAEEVTTEDKTYTMAEMDQANELLQGQKAWGVETENLSDGGQILKFGGLYNSIFWTVPAELKDAEITQIKFNVKPESVSGIEGANPGWFGYKIFVEEGFIEDKKNEGNGIGEGYSMYGNPTREVPSDLGAPIKYLAITSSNDGITGPVEMEISSITFTVKKDASSESGSDENTGNTPNAGGSGNGETSDGGSGESIPEITAEVTTTDVDKTYSLGKLTEKKLGNVKATYNEASGSMKLEYAGQYGEANYEIPEDIDFSKVKKIAITLKSGNAGDLAIKTYTQADWDAENVYQTDVEYGKGYLVPTTDLADVKYIGISSLPEGTTSAVVESITFTVEGAVTYPISLLEEQNVDGVTVTVDNGSEKLDFASQYKEIDYKVPAEINFANVKKVSFKLTDGTAESLTIKTYTQADWDATGVYETDAAYGWDYIEPKTDVADVKYIALANNGEAAKSITVESVTFTYTEASSVGVNPDAEEDDSTDDSDIQITAKVTTTDVDKTYSLGKLTEKKLSNVKATHNEASGSMKLEYAGQYGEANYEIPEDIDFSKVKKIAITLKSGNAGNLAIKTYTQADWDAEGVYETDVEYGKGYLVPTTDLADVKYIGISSLPEGTTEAVVESITFTVEGSVTYPVSLLEEVKKDGVTVTVDNGSEKLDFASQYKEIDYTVPADVNFANVKKVSFKLTDGTAENLTIKTYTQADWDATGVYETDAAYGWDYIEPKTDVADVKYIALANNGEAAKSITVESVTFTYTEASSVGVNPDAEDDTEGDDGNTTEEGVLEYDASQLEARVDWSGAKFEKNADKIVVTTGAQYDELKIILPEMVDMSKCESITLTVSDQTVPIAAKIWSTDGKEEQCVYDLTGATEYTITPTTAVTTNLLGVMSMSNSAGTFSVVGVKIKMKPDDTKKVYGVNELDARVDWSGATFVEDSEKIAISTKAQYDELKIILPEAVDMSSCEYITLKVADQTVPIAVKIWSTDGKEEQCVYDLTGATEYTIIPNTSVTTNLLGVMSMSTSEGGVSLISVTVKMNPDSGSGSSTPSNVVGENIIINGNFADADVSMWNSAQGANSVITAETAAEAILGDVKTYGKISRDPAKAAAGDCFQQDVTDRVEKGGEYYIEYYAMLSDEYANAPDNQKKVEFGPFFVLDGSNNYLGTAYSSELSGFNTQSAKVGEWTKYSGYITISCRGEEDRVVLRFIEQGTDYGSGDCVKGDYYITGVSMRQTDKPVPEIPEIEKDIPDWRDTIVGDLGAGTIAGTAVTYSEMRDETLWELVTKHFNAVTFGNELKMDAMLGNAKGETEQITFNGAALEVPVIKFEEKSATAMLDKILAWNTANPDKKLKVRGHVLVWHSQAPDWFFKENYDVNADFVSKDVMDLRLEWYIKTVLEYYTGADSKYKDLFYGWDVVNEAISDGTGTYRAASEGESGNPNEWASVYGSQSNEYIIKAFRWANKYAPASLELYYNDYNDCVPSKVEGIVKLLEAVKAAEGTRIDGMGMQAHHNIDSPSVEQVEAAVRAYCAVVGKVQWTELDIKASSSYDGTDATREEEYNKMAHRYKAYYDVLKKLDAEDGIEVGGIIFWGTVDKYSWLQTSNNVGGASNGGNQCPLLFDDNYKAKPVYWAFVDPSKLTPEVQNIIIAQKVDDEYISGSEYSMEKGTTKATVIPMWDTTGLKVVVKVQDVTVDATDAITVYVDPAMKAGATTPVKATVKRADAKAVDGGYEAEVAVALDSVGALKSVAMDVVVVNGTDSVAFNDTTLSQETSSKYYANGLMKIGTTVENGTIVVDGIVDEKWAKADEIPLKLGTVDAKPTFKVLWDKDYLYVLAEVKDTVLNKEHKDAWMQDSIEVFIDENNKKTTGYDADDKQYRINYENEPSFNGQKCKAENMKSATKAVEGGYVIEAAFKWTDITPANGTNVGFELQLNDAVSSTVRNKVNWADDTDKGWSGSNVFGTITLVGDLALPEMVDALEKLVDENATKEEKVQAVKDIITEVKELVEAGQKEELTNALIEEIETLFKESIGRVLNVVNKNNSVPKIDKVIGALIGIDADKEAKMVFEAVTAPSLEAKYKNAFAFDAKLFAADTAIQPVVPVTIRMALPPSIDKTKKVVVLHYADGAKTPEILESKVDNSFIEITTYHFSTFVIANEVEVANNTTNNTTNNTPAATPTPAPSTDSGVKAPATGDSAYPVAAVAVLLLSGSAAVIMAKKRKKEEEE